MILSDYVPYIKICTTDSKNVVSENLDELKKLIANNIKFFTVVNKTTWLHILFKHSINKYKRFIDVEYGYHDMRHYHQVQLAESGYSILTNIIKRDFYVYRMFKDNSLSNSLLKEIYKEINS